MLRKAGIECTLQRTPRWMEERGCGYCLRLRRNAAFDALEQLRQQGVPFRKVYVQRQDGTLEEREL